MQWAVLLLDTTLVWQSRWSRDLVSFGSARGRTAEVARLGGARAVAEKKLRKNLQVEEPRDFYSLFCAWEKKKTKSEVSPSRGGLRK